jgi:cysteine desulfurase
VIYLDNSSTTHTDPEVLEAMLPWLSSGYGNASSTHTIGSLARVTLEDARGTIAQHLGVDAKEIVFTSGGTESNNTAIKGAIFQQHLVGVSFSQQSILTSKAEHHSVLHPIEFLEKLGVQQEFAQIDASGIVLMDSLAQSLRKNTSLVTFMMVNNEIGSINPIQELATIVRSNAPNTLIHTDAVQALGKLRFNARTLGVDLLSLSAHKIHGPKGIGALYIKSGTKLEPFMHGGAQERNRRGGTEAVALAVGFAKAVELLEKKWSASEAHMRELSIFLKSMLSYIPQVVMNLSSDAQCVDSIINFSFTPATLKKIDGEALLMRLDLEGIAISNGSACTSGSQQPSHVLLAIGKSEKVAASSIRVSLSRESTQEDITQFIAALKRVLPV